MPKLNMEVTPELESLLDEMAMRPRAERRSLMHEALLQGLNRQLLITQRAGALETTLQLLDETQTYARTPREQDTIDEARALLAKAKGVTSASTSD
jgi:hypothetical protein